MNALDKIKTVNDICLFVKDFDGALEFYKKKFGMIPKRLQPSESDANYAELDFEGTTVTLWARSGVYDVIDSRYVEGGGHPFMIAVKVPAISDVNDIYDAFSANGVVCIKEPATYAFGSRAAYFLDYEENIWEIFAWVDGDGPGLL
jgi:catechol 2,3-dioxygenase-like lactoylglutathione lyase family enzyme